MPANPARTCRGCIAGLCRQFQADFLAKRLRRAILPITPKPVSNIINVSGSCVEVKRSMTRMPCAAPLAGKPQLAGAARGAACQPAGWVASTELPKSAVPTVIGLKASQLLLPNVFVVDSQPETRPAIASGWADALAVAAKAPAELSATAQATAINVSFIFPPSAFNKRTS